ncbi:hypothetical protein [Lichenicoccus roseus]|uniref:Uncharacterized protein n=1 Tax=Lichenicoccus roseus TaxID=2683649 RepID=A0A5R9J389_9PROT|nr:hypothetical protein [Lichenicoccus roseus]TLU72022.1 hypothetical protein FE263_12870 [Lichenicoccus roseus]
MTTFVMNAATVSGTGLGTLVPASVSTASRQVAARFELASMRINEWALDHLLDAAGGFTLALLPFSFLAWTFITR